MSIVSYDTLREPFQDFMHRSWRSGQVFLEWVEKKSAYINTRIQKKKIIALASITKKKKKMNTTNE